MKLPAVAIAAAFACGIVLGLCLPFAGQVSARNFIVGGLILAGCLILAGLVLTGAGQLGSAVTVSLLCWTLLGASAARIADQPLPADHVVILVNDGRLDLHTALRWYGKLRDEPAKLPWGLGYEIELHGVDYRNARLPVEGGMRVSFSPRPDEPRLPELHAGDDVAILTQAKRPQVFKDEGAFDRRAYLATHNIDLVATLRAVELIQRLSPGRLTLTVVLARARRRLREEVDTLFAARPQAAGVLRAMLLGDRSFVDRDEAVDFQKTGVFHVLVVAGLHVGALAALLFWLGRRLRLSPVWTIAFTLTVLWTYVVVVEQRPPVLRAAVMAAIVVIGGFFYRRLDLLNSTAVAALFLLVWRPLTIRDSSFQLSFLAIGCIAGLALPWLAQTAQPYVRALRGWRDVTRDVGHEPRQIQFRIDLRALAGWTARRLPVRLNTMAQNMLIGGIGVMFRIWELLVLTVALQIGMLPLMARDFHRITLAAPIVNLIAVPLTSAVVPLGFVMLGCALLVPAMGRILAVPLGWLTALLLRVVQWFAHFPRLSYRVPGPPLWLVILFFLFLGLLVVTLRVASSWKRRAFVTLCAALAVCSVAIAVFPFAPKWSPGKLEVTVLDVGQGDSLFVVSPHGKTLLIDGGGSFGGFAGRPEHYGIDPGEDAVSPYLWSRGYRQIDAVALTHAHQDHVGGLIAVLENFRLGTLWLGREATSPALAALERLAREKHIPVKRQGRGNSFHFDDVLGQFFWPETSADGNVAVAKNNDSLVLKLQYGNRTILLPGDAEKDAEREMLAENEKASLSADVLKVGHHGGKNSTMPEFLAAVKPRLAVISVGEDNSYGHPSLELLERLETSGARILRTDRQGAVHLLTDGEHIEISCFVACPQPSPEQAATNSGRAQAPDGEKKSQQQ